MPTIPKKVELNARAADILNVIRDNGTPMYQQYVPVADPEQNNVRAIGNVIMNYPELQNEFLGALINRIARVIIKSKMYQNPWAMFKQGYLELGEVVNEVFVNLATPFEYNPELAEEKVFKRVIPDVQSAFHVMNYKKFYKQTIQNNDLRQAFLSWQGIEDLIAKIVESMYTAANYDEFLTMKYMLALFILNGRFKAVEIADPENVDNLPAVITELKSVSNNLEFISNEYNVAGVRTYTPKDSQYLILTGAFDASNDVNVLASAFNMDKAQFLGHRVLVDGFDKLDTDRLDLLFRDDPNYVKLTEEQLTALSKIPAVLVDRDWFMVFDNLIEMGEIYNSEGLYWNYTFHVWKTFSSSPFANAIVFVPTKSEAKSITVTPTTAVIAPETTVQFTADVKTDGFATKAVNWTIEPETEGVTVDIYGNVTVGKDVSVGTTFKVKATSVANGSSGSPISDDSTVTVGKLSAVPAVIGAKTVTGVNGANISYGTYYAVLDGAVLTGGTWTVTGNIGSGVTTTMTKNGTDGGYDLYINSSAGGGKTITAGDLTVKYTHTNSESGTLTVHVNAPLG